MFSIYGFFTDDIVLDNRAVRRLVNITKRAGLIYLSRKRLFATIHSLRKWRYPLMAGMRADYEHYGYIVYPLILSKNVYFAVNIARILVNRLGLKYAHDPSFAKTIRQLRTTRFFVFPDGEVAKIGAPEPRALPSSVIRFVLRLVVPVSMDTLNGTHSSYARALKKAGYVKTFKEGGRTWVTVKKEVVGEIIGEARRRVNLIISTAEKLIREIEEIVVSGEYVERLAYNKLVTDTSKLRGLVVLMRNWASVPVVVESRKLKETLARAEAVANDPFVFIKTRAGIRTKR